GVLPSSLPFHITITGGSTTSETSAITDSLALGGSASSSVGLGRRRFWAVRPPALLLDDESAAATFLSFEASRAGGVGSSGGLGALTSTGFFAADGSATTGRSVLPSTFESDLPSDLVSTRSGGLSAFSTGAKATVGEGGAGAGAGGAGGLGLAPDLSG